MATFAKKAFHGTVLMIVLGMVSNVLAYVLRLILARSLPKEDFGLFYAVVAVIGVLYIATHLGLNEALTRHVSTARVRNDSSSIKAATVFVLGVQIALALVVVAIIAVFSSWISQRYFHHPMAAMVLVVHAAGMILLPFETVFMSLFQGYQEMSWLGSVNAARMGVVVAFTALYLYLGFGVLSPAMGYLSWYGVAIIVYTPVVVRRLLPGFFSIKYQLTVGLAKELFGFGLPVIFSAVAGVVISSIDTIMITALTGSLEEVAIYNVALPTASVLWFFSAALSIVLFPITSELWERKYHAHLREGIELVYRYAFLLITPVALTFGVFPDVVIQTLFGEGFSRGAPVLRVLAIGGILFTFFRINEAFLSGMGYPKVNSRIVWTGAVVTVVGNAVLIPIYGIMGAAIGTVISFAVILGMGMYSLRKRVEFHVPWLGWVKTAIAGVIFMALLSWLKVSLPLPVWPRIFVGTALSLMVYAFLILALNVVTISEIKAQIARVW